jgi:class 3 adenylate cyclase
MPRRQQPSDPGRRPASPAPDEVARLSRQVQAITRFPDQNPNPVMRVTQDGHLLYANPASQPIRQALGAEVGDPLPPEMFAQLRAAAAAAEPSPIEVVHDHRTYELLAVAVPEMGFINLYGTDVTARKAIDKFPDQNPNPVLRVDDAGRLIYANRASAPIVEAQQLELGAAMPPDLLGELRAGLARPDQPPIELTCGERIYEVLPVTVPEFGFINIYGTEVTAARQVAEANRENERLLLNILPPPIAERLRRGEKVIADRFEDVTLLIADIVGFTSLSSRLSATQVVDLLNGIFGACDELVDRHGLEKVKTIGDAYMVVGGIPTQMEDHVERVADLALDLGRRVDEMIDGSAQPISVRIGMHCGPAVAGVIGVKKFIYDVWGDTVNMASRMEALGVPGRIHVSQSVHDRLRDRYRLEPRGILEVKGKGPLPTWFLVGRKAGRAHLASPLQPR